MWRFKAVTSIRLASRFCLMRASTGSMPRAQWWTTEPAHLGQSPPQPAGLFCSSRGRSLTQPVFQAGNDVHSLMQDGKNQRRATGLWKAEDVVPPRHLHPQAGMNRTQVREHTLTDGNFVRSFLDLLDVDAALGFAPCFGRVAGDFTKIACRASGKDIGTGQTGPPWFNTSSATSTMLRSITSPRCASASRCDSRACRSCKARSSSDAPENRRSRAYCLMVLPCSAAMALRA